MGSPERIREVARRVARFAHEGHQLGLVPWAMAGETNRLLALAKEINPEAEARELDVIASTGEQVSIGLLAIALHALGLKAKSYTGWQVPITTDNAFAKARILKIEEKRIQADLDAGNVVIVAGFQGIDDGHTITTLGPGGSNRPSLPASHSTATKRRSPCSAPPTAPASPSRSWDPSRRQTSTST